MMHAVAPAALLLITAAAVLLPDRAAPLKCPLDPRFPDAPETVFVVNGTPGDRESFARLSPDSIDDIEIICVEDLLRVFNVKSQRGGVLIFTIPGPRRQMETALDSVAVLQRAHLARHGRFAASLAELPWRDATGGLMRIDVAVSEDGATWAATARHRHIIRDGPRTITGEKPGGRP